MLQAINSFDELVITLEADISQENILIGIDGFRQSGKTTLLNNLKKALPSVIIFDTDDFILDEEEIPLAQRTSYQSVLDFKKLREQVIEIKGVSTIISGICLLDTLQKVQIIPDKIIYIKRCVQHGDLIIWKDAHLLSDPENYHQDLDKEIVPYHNRTNVYESADYIFERIESF